MTPEHIKAVFQSNLQYIPGFVETYPTVVQQFLDYTENRRLEDERSRLIIEISKVAEKEARLAEIDALLEG